MEEAVVEALVLVALIGIATILGGYMVYSSTMIAKSIEERSAKNTAANIEASILEACTNHFARPDRPSRYDSVTITINLTGRSTVWLRPWGIIVEPQSKTRALISRQSLEDLCSRALGTRVNVQIAEGSIVGTQISLELKLQEGNLTIRPAG